MPPSPHRPKVTLQSATENFATSRASPAAPEQEKTKSKFKCALRRSSGNFVHDFSLHHNPPTMRIGKDGKVCIAHPHPHTRTHNPTQNLQEKLQRSGRFGAGGKTSRRATYFRNQNKIHWIPGPAVLAGTAAEPECTFFLRGGRWLVISIALGRTMGPPGRVEFGIGSNLAFIFRLPSYLSVSLCVGRKEWHFNQTSEEKLLKENAFRCVDWISSAPPAGVTSSRMRHWMWPRTAGEDFN